MRRSVLSCGRESAGLGALFYAPNALEPHCTDGWPLVLFLHGSGERGAEDEQVPLEHSQRVVQAVQAAGGDARLTVYEGVGHDSWTRTYDDPRLYAWLLSHWRHQRER